MCHGGINIWWTKRIPCTQKNHFTRLLSPLIPATVLSDTWRKYYFPHTNDPEIEEKEKECQDFLEANFIKKSVVLKWREGNNGYRAGNKPQEWERSEVWTDGIGNDSVGTRSAGKLCTWNARAVFMMRCRTQGKGPPAWASLAHIPWKDARVSPPISSHLLWLREGPALIFWELILCSLHSSAEL